MSDWWQSNQTPFNGPFTPTRPLSYSNSNPGTTSQHYRARFNLGDELDPEDARMAESIRFAPSFAASPAGKLVMGSSSGGGGGGGGGGQGNVQGGGGGMGSPGNSGMAASPPGTVRAGRSPTGRFSNPESAASPRDSRRKTMTQVFDEDMPPTASLRDTQSDSPVRPLAMAPTTQLPTPPSLTPSSTTTLLLIFGPPQTLLRDLEPYFSQIGPIKSYKPGPEGCNWWILEYDSPVSAAYALRRHGDVLGGKYMLGVRVGEGSLSGWGGGGGGGGGGGEVGNYSNGAMGGNQLTVKKGNVLRNNEEKRGAGNGDWDDGDGTGTGGGVTGRIADWLFGR